MPYVSGGENSRRRWNDQAGISSVEALSAVPRIWTRACRPGKIQLIATEFSMVYGSV